MSRRSSLPLALLVLPLATVPAAQVRASTLTTGTLGEPIVVASGVSVREDYVHPAWAVATANRSTPPAVFPPTGGGTPPLCLQNGAIPGAPIYYRMLPGQELVDWGTKACGGAGVVTACYFHVRTSALAASAGGPGTTFGCRLWAGGTGGAPGQLGTLVASYTVSAPIGTTPGGPPVSAIFPLALPTTLRLSDGPLAWSYVDLGQGHELAFVATAGGACGSAARDPLTGTQDCLADYDAPAGAGGTFHGQGSPVAGLGSLFFALTEPDPHPAGAVAYEVAPNPLSYTCEAPVIGRPWSGAVDLTTTGHAFALVLAFDRPIELRLAGGQWLLVADGGSGELFGFLPRPGPLAVFSGAIPLDLSLVGAYVGTQAIQVGAVAPFALSNAMDLTIGS